MIDYKIYKEQLSESLVNNSVNDLLIKTFSYIVVVYKMETDEAIRIKADICTNERNPTTVFN